jgi:hypothetical protein
MVGIALVAAQDWITATDRKALARSKRLANLYVAYLGVLLVYLLVRNGVTGGLAVPDTFYLDNPLVGASPGVRILTALTVIGRGVGAQLLPLNLSPDYSFNAIPLVESVSDWRFLATVAVAAVSIGSLRDPRARKPAILLAVAWYFITVFPTSNLLLTVGTIFGDRLLYLPSVAVCILAGGGMGWALRRWGRPALVPVAALFLAFSYQTVRYTGAWENDISLFRWAVAAVPGSTKAQHKLGEELLRAGNPASALGPLKRSLEIAPDNQFAAQTLAVATRHLSDLAAAQLSRGDTATALQNLQTAVANQPRLASAWYTLARIHLSRSETREAVHALQEFLSCVGTGYQQEANWAERILATLGSDPGSR